MKMSRMGSVTKKTRADNDNKMMEFLVQAGQAKQVGAGIYSYGTILLKARQNLENFIREKLEKYDCVEVSLPTLQPRQLWDSSNRWAKFTASGTMFTTKGKNGEYCLAPTGEEIMFDYVNTIIKSYKDMPLCLFQIGTKYRDEIRVRGGILRSKEFLMKDAYSFHTCSEDLNREYENMKRCYLEIFSELGLNPIPVMACSGDMGGKISEEFMVESELGEDTILFDENTGKAFNIEVLEDNDLKNFYQEKYPNIDFGKLKKMRTIELGHIFQLDQFYSKAMNGVFTNGEGKQDYYYMGCYGIGITRTLGTLIEHYLDENGLNFPAKIAPFNVGIANMQSDELNKVSNEIYSALIDKGVKVLWDDRNFNMGYKLKDLALLGVRNNIIIGNNYLKTGMVEYESDGGKEELTIDELLEKF